MKETAAFQLFLSNFNKEQNTKKNPKVLSDI